MLLLGASFIIKLLLGFPFFIIIFGSLYLFLFIYHPEFDMTIIPQQIITGIRPMALIAIPMFIFAASIITHGKSSEKVIKLVSAFFGHFPGGLAITTAVSCALFGSVSGSSQATVAAIGGTLRPMLRKAGYPSSFTLGLIINASDIAFIIPPSIGFIIYGVISRTSIGSLFLSGILPGILILILFSIYSIFYAKFAKIPVLEKATLQERIIAFKECFPVLGFPIIILGGIYSGIFSPTEAAAVSVFYALIVEKFVFRSIDLSKIIDSMLSTGIITAVVMILIGAGQAASWFLSFLRIPQQVLPAVLGTDPTQTHVFIVIIAAYLIGCMFVDPTVVIYVFTPIFLPYATMAGIDPILLGLVVTMQVAIGSATPPFGCDIFTAQLVFRRPYLEVIRHTYPFIIILFFATYLVIQFPQIALFIPNMAR